MNKSISFCRPIIVDNFAALKKELAESDPRYDYLEIWLDYIEDLNLDQLKSCFSMSKSKLIFLFRRLNLDSPKLSKELRDECINYLLTKNCYLDLDLTQTEDLDLLCNKLSGADKLLLSYHNYQNTPDNTELLRLLGEMQKFTPAIIKFATKCLTPEDCLRMLEFGLQLKSRQQKCIITTMGEYGALPRIQAALYFNEFNFAPQKLSESSATGQVELDKFIELISFFS
jgi:3-dehydroquinate dehydratase type I